MVCFLVYVSCLLEELEEFFNAGVFSVERVFDGFVEVFVSPAVLREDSQGSF